MPYVDASGAKLYFEEYGEGYPASDYRTRSRTPELRLLASSTIELGEETADANVVPLHQEQSPF